MPAMASREFNRLKRLCLALPEAHEQEAWGEPTFRIRGKMFAMFAAPTNHHGRGRPAVWIKSSPVNQDLRVMTEPDTFFVPPYMGPLGWVGMWLDRDADWVAVQQVLREGYAMLAPKALLTQLDATPPRKAAVKRAVEKKAAAKKAPVRKAAVKKATVKKAARKPVKKAAKKRA